MKRFLGLLVVGFLFNSCDDGNLTVDTVDFGTATVQGCGTANNIVYKIKDKEALLLDIPATSFPTEPTPLNTPKILTIGSENKVIYRFYNGTVTADNICKVVQPISPTATSEWIATSGKIVIISTADKTTNPIDNSTRIVGLKHNITFTDITFQKSNGTSQLMQTLDFGNYAQTISGMPTILYDKVIKRCSNTSNLLYVFTTADALTLNIDPSLLNTTTLNTPKTGIITATTNTLTYKAYTNGILDISYFCATTLPVTPTVNDVWSAQNGVANTSGIIEVTTLSNGPASFKHTIKLKKVTLTKGNFNLTLGDSYLLGDLITPQ